MTRLIKAGWFFSLFITLGVLLYTYASLPGMVAYEFNNLGDGTSSIERETFFYLGLLVLTVTNFSLYILSKNLRYNSESAHELMMRWQYSFAAVINLFLVVIMIFLYLANSGENFNFDSFGYMIFVSLGLIFIWVLSLPVIILKARK